jgi:hypothetical protein
MEEPFARVRNSHMHGEKFVGGRKADQRERHMDLVSEALAVLREDKDCEPTVAAILAQK